MKVRNLTINLYWLMRTQLGLDPRRMFRSLCGMPRYLRDFFRFRAGYSGRLGLRPCLQDWYEEAGQTKNEYFLQDLLVARKVFEAKPEKHVDIGSRVDGFVAHVASFREIEVFDVRPIASKIPGVTFKQADLMAPIQGLADYCDSLSCLHTLEHFGLGRYGDPIDPRGHERGLANMATLLRQDGFLYLSVPIGIDRVEFNANRIFDPRIVLDMAMQNSLAPISLTVIHSGGKIEVSALDDYHLSKLRSLTYSLGVFVFVKHTNG